MPFDPEVVQPLTPVVNRSVGGGVNTRVFATDIRDDQAVLLQNIDGSTPGQRVSRAGYSLTATGIANGPILALSEFGPRAAAAGSEDHFLLAVAPGGSAGDHKLLYQWNGTGTQWTQVGTLSGYTADPATEEGKCHISVGFDFNITNKYAAVVACAQEGTDRYYYDGSGAGALPQCHYGDGESPNRLPFHYAHNRGFGVGQGTGYKNVLYYSDVAQWTTTGFHEGLQGFLFGGGTGQRIVALKEFRAQELIVFLTDRIEELVMLESNIGFLQRALSPYETWQRKVIDPTIGCGAMDSVATVGEDIYFVDQYGHVRSLARTIQDNNSGTKSDPISDPIVTWIDRVNPAARKNITAASHGRRYLVGLPIDSATTPTHVFVYDVVRRAWDGPWTNINPQCMAVGTLEGASRDSDKNPTLFVGSTYTAEGRVLRMFDGNDDMGTDIVYQEETARHDWGALDYPKYPRIFKFMGVSSALATMQVEVNPDGEGYQHLGYISMLGNTPALPEPLPFYLGGTGVLRNSLSLDALDKVYDLQFRFTCTADGQVRTLGYWVGAFVDKIELECD